MRILTEVKAGETVIGEAIISPGEVEGSWVVHEVFIKTPSVDSVFVNRKLVYERSEKMKEI